MLGALILFFGVGYAIAKLNPAAIYGKRAAAIVWAKAAGLDRYLTNVRASGNGWVFVVPVDMRRDFLTQLERKPALGVPPLGGGSQRGSFEASPLKRELQTLAPGPAFLRGSLYLFHAKEANCQQFGQCADYRSPNGSIGPGSLQIVYNRETGQGFLDYDQWNPYESWGNFARHAGEI